MTQHQTKIKHSDYYLLFNILLTSHSIIVSVKYECLMVVAGCSEEQGEREKRLAFSLKRNHWNKLILCRLNWHGNPSSEKANSESNLESALLFHWAWRQTDSKGRGIVWGCGIIKVRNALENNKIGNINSHGPASANLLWKAEVNSTVAFQTFPLSGRLSAVSSKNLPLWGYLSWSVTTAWRVSK